MLVIFDLDGTLLNTLDDLAVAANHALKVCGFAPRSVEECRNFVGNGVSKLLERSLPDGARTSAHLEQMRQAFFAYYDAHLWNHTLPYPGIEETLNALQARRVKLAVASNKYQSATERLTKHFFPSVSFVSVLGQRDTVPLKPHPQIVQDILHVSAEQKENCLYVGDSQVDMQTAQNAGVKACAVGWGFRTQAELRAYHPVYFISQPSQLLDLVQ